MAPLPPLPTTPASDLRAGRAPTARRGGCRAFVVRFQLAIPIFLCLAAPSALAESAAAGPDGAACEPGTVRLASYHFVVDGIVLERLQGHVDAGDNFTVVVDLAECDGAPRWFAMDLNMPPCNSPFRTPVLSVLKGLNSGNVSDDSESALVQDVEAAMTCEPFHATPAVLGVFAAASVGATGGAGGVLVWRHRRRK